MTALSAAASEVEVMPPSHQPYQNIEALSELPLSLLQQSKNEADGPTCSVQRCASAPVESMFSAAAAAAASSADQQIDPRFIMPRCTLPPAREFQLVEEFVAGAIQSKSNPSMVDPKYRQGYRAILDALRRRDDPPMLRKVLLALRTSGKGSTLHQLTTSPSSTHAQLIHLIFRLDPFELPPALKKNEHDEKEAALAQPILDFSLTDAHFHLIMALVSANSVFLSSAVNALWKLVMTQIDDAPEERIQRVHAALATIIRICPKAKMELFPVMASNFPFRTRPASHLIWYCRHCFTALDYLPNIHGQVLELIIERSLEIDVEIKINDGGEVSFDQENDEGIFEMDLDASGDKPSPVKIDPTEVTVDEMADKLDSLMLLLYDHIQSRTKMSADMIRQFYEMVSPAFDSSILITHKSKFVQFIIFLLCGMDSRRSADNQLPVIVGGNELYRDFAAKLIEVILDPYRATVTRQSGACYLASFVSRASYVCPETVCETVSALLRWAEAYMASWDPLASRASDSRHQCESHLLFYTICQAAFYIMCFRGDQAVRHYQGALEHLEKEGKQNAETMYLNTEMINIGRDRWTRLCGHALEPLRFCLESVRCEFLHVTRVFDLIDPVLLDQLVVDARPSSRLYTDRRRGPTRISTAATLEKQRVDGGIGGLGRGSNPLDSFFPFDPYLLRRSHTFIEPFYNEWNGPIEEEEFAEPIADDDVGPSDVVKEDAVAEEAATVRDDEGNDAMAISRENDIPSSLASSTKTLSIHTDAANISTSPDASSKKETQKLDWRASLKRSRAYSGENGSW